MLRTLAISSVTAALTAAPPALAKPCDGRTATPALEQMLPLARTALDLAGTDGVTLDPAGRCIGIQVRTAGTARLVKLILRGVEVPRSAVDLRVADPQRVTGA